MSSAESSFNIKSMENNKRVSTRFVMMSACSPLTGMAEALSILFPWRHCRRHWIPPKMYKCGREWVFVDVGGCAMSHSKELLRIGTQFCFLKKWYLSYTRSTDVADLGRHESLSENIQIKYTRNSLSLSLSLVTSRFQEKHTAAHTHTGRLFTVLVNLCLRNFFFEKKRCD